MKSVSGDKSSKSINYLEKSIHQLENSINYLEKSIHQLENSTNSCIILKIQLHVINSNI